MKRTGRVYPQVRTDTSGSNAVGQAGGVLLTRAVEVTGVGGALSAALGRWRKPFAVHDPGKIITDLAVSLALGGDCLADVALIRSEPGVYGRVASDPTISRLVTQLAKNAPAALKAINAARAAGRAKSWALAGERSPGHGTSQAAPLIIDVDADLDSVVIVDAEVALVEQDVNIRSEQQTVVEAMLAALPDWSDVRRLQYWRDLGAGDRAATMIGSEDHAFECLLTQARDGEPRVTEDRARYSRRGIARALKKPAKSHFHVAVTGEFIGLPADDVPGEIRRAGDGAIVGLEEDVAEQYAADYGVGLGGSSAVAVDRPRQRLTAGDAVALAEEVPSLTDLQPCKAAHKPATDQTVVRIVRLEEERLARAPRPKARIRTR